MAELIDLIIKAQRIGGFYVYVSPNGINKSQGSVKTRGFDHNHGGFSGGLVRDKTEWLVATYAAVDHLMPYQRKELREKLGINDVDEAVTYGDHVFEREKGRIFKKSVDWPGTADEFLACGGKERLAEMLYQVRHATDTDRGIGMQLGLLAPASLVYAIAKELKKQPGRAFSVFDGTFPELERHRHMPNGRILIAQAEDVSLDKVARGRNYFNQFIHEYELNQKQ